MSQVNLKTSYGDMIIELDTVNTPITSANFKQYVEDGFYDGTLFHRVIDGFIIQGGGFESKMKPKLTRAPIKNEANKHQKNTRGSVAMARATDPHSASAQFFINVEDNDFLNHKDHTPDGWGYCVFGHVVRGMEVVDQIKSVSTTNDQRHQDIPKTEVLIQKAFLLD